MTSVVKNCTTATLKITVKSPLRPSCEGFEGGPLQICNTDMKPQTNQNPCPKGYHAIAEWRWTAEVTNLLGETKEISVPSYVMGHPWEMIEGVMAEFEKRGMKFQKIKEVAFVKLSSIWRQSTGEPLRFFGEMESQERARVTTGYQYQPGDVAPLDRIQAALELYEEITEFLNSRKSQ